MDSFRGFDDEVDFAQAAEEEAAMDAPPEIGVDERRMHVRAYNYWVSLLNGRPFPAIGDVDPHNLEDFGPHSVLLDFTGGGCDPKIAFLGRTLRAECGLDGDVERTSAVPGRSLLSRVTDHYLQIIANSAPIGFEAEFVNQRGLDTLYRGILMPLSSNGEAIDFIYGVINWKELVDRRTAFELASAVDSAVSAAPAAGECPVWADGPNSQSIARCDEEQAPEDEPTLALSRRDDLKGEPRRLDADVVLAELRARPALTLAAIEAEGGEFVLLLAKRAQDGGLALVAAVPQDEALIARAIRKAA